MHGTIAAQDSFTDGVSLGLSAAGMTRHGLRIFLFAKPLPHPYPIEDSLIR